MDAEAFAVETDDTRRAIMWATFEALQKHGYAGLSIQRIADETDLSKSTFYHHYENKDDLLLSFLQFMLGEFVRELSATETGDPRADLEVFLDTLLLRRTKDGVSLKEGEPRPDPEAVIATIVELRAQAVHDERYREQFTAADRFVSERLADIVERGIERGVFAPVDVERTVDTIVTMVFGSLLRPTTTTAEGTDPASVEAFVRRRLFANEPGDGTAT